MTDAETTIQDLRERLLSAALPHVPFDGWGPATFAAAVADSGTDPALARSLCPRAGTDLAIAFHRGGDRAMLAALAATDLAGLRFRDRVALAVRLRIEAAAPHKEAVRRGAALFALPGNAATGARLVWDTADAIWAALGDTSDDVNWYTRRATLTAVYGATVLFWLGDASADSGPTWAFLDRRIEDVMRIEKAKAGLRDNALAQRVLAGPLAVLARIRPPGAPRVPGGFPRR